MEFEYDKELRANSLIDIPDIGDFGLEAYNLEGYYHYLFVKTILGETYVATCGPVIPDTSLITYGFSINITHFQYNEKALFKYINTFLNDRNKAIVGVNLMSAEDVVPYFSDIPQTLSNILSGKV